MMPPQRKRAAIYILLIFLCGALAGVAATNLWRNWGPGSVSARADQPYTPQNVVERFTRDLSLSPDQARQLNQILDETHKAYREHEAQMDAVRQQGRGRIREILNDDQKAKYEQILAQIDQRRKQRRLRPAAR